MNSIKAFKIALIFPLGQISTIHAEAQDPYMAIDARPLTDITFKATPERIERGRYMTEDVLYCFRCHGEEDKTAEEFTIVEGTKGAGRIIQRADNIYPAPNLTPDKETGAADWTDDMFARAIREGIGHDGRALMTRMPFQRYQYLSDEDVASIIVYLRTLKPVHSELPQRTINENTGASLVARPNLNKGSVKQPDPNNPIAQGEYLVKLSNCAGCHSPDYSGGRMFHADSEKPVVSANLTSDESGIGNLTPEAFTFILRTGKGGTLDEEMPWKRYKRMNDNDLAAMFHYFKSTKPVSHYVINLIDPTFCGICGKDHGWGDRNHFTPLAAFDPDYVVPWDISGEYRSANGRGFVKITREDGEWMMTSHRQTKTRFVPVSENEFQIQGDETVFSFGVDEENQVNTIKINSDGREFVIPKAVAEVSI